VWWAAQAAHHTVWPATLPQSLLTFRRGTEMARGFPGLSSEAGGWGRALGRFAPFVVAGVFIRSREGASNSEAEMSAARLPKPSVRCFRSNVSVQLQANQIRTSEASDPCIAWQLQRVVSGRPPRRAA
jgi:hypothetical protein